MEAAKAIELSDQIQELNTLSIANPLPSQDSNNRRNTVDKKVDELNRILGFEPEPSNLPSMWEMVKSDGATYKRKKPIDLKDIHHLRLIEGGSNGV